MTKITNEEVLSLIKERGLNLKQVIDVIVDINGWKGFNLIRFGKEVKEYIWGQPEKRITAKTKI